MDEGEQIFLKRGNVEYIANMLTEKHAFSQFKSIQNVDEFQPIIVLKPLHNIGKTEKLKFSQIYT